MSKLKIMAERCNQCLFGPDKIVSNKRRSEILREIRRQDSYFICHKASAAGLKIACHGDWEQNRCGNLGRVMSRIGGIEFVPELGTAPCDEPPKDEDAKAAEGRSPASAVGVAEAPTPSPDPASGEAAV